MKHAMTIKKTMLILSGCLLLASGGPAQAGNVEMEELQGYIELFRSDLNTAKVSVINETLQLTAEEQSTFWPIYREYEVELAALGDARLALIRTFAQAHRTDTLDDAKAGELIQGWFAGKQGRLDLWKRTSQKIGEALSPKRAAQFLQIEHEIALVIDMGVASSIPQIGGDADAE